MMRGGLALILTIAVLPIWEFTRRGTNYGDLRLYQSFVVLASLRKWSEYSKHNQFNCDELIECPDKFRGLAFRGHIALRKITPKKFTPYVMLPYRNAARHDSRECA